MGIARCNPYFEGDLFALVDFADCGGGEVWVAGYPFGECFLFVVFRPGIVFVFVKDDDGSLGEVWGDVGEGVDGGAVEVAVDVGDTDWFCECVEEWLKCVLEESFDDGDVGDFGWVVGCECSFGEVDAPVFG